TCNKPCVRLYNLLDVMNKTPDIYNQTKLDYEECEIAATISYTVKSDIRKKFQTNKEINVIGFPIRDKITYKHYSVLGVPFLYVGRVLDPNKRIGLIKPTLDKLGFNSENMVFVGPDRAPFGFETGILSDDDLCEIYNCADFLFLPSEREGLGMTAIEGVIGNCHIIGCSDNPIFNELGLSEFTATPHPAALTQLVNKIQKNYPYYKNILDKLRPKFLAEYTVEAVVKKMLNLYKEYINENQ
ncbi:MAG: glycosyltransferase, partial [Nanoarchaeota archaeon]